LITEISSYYVGFEVLTAVVMKNIIFWDITPCSPLIVNSRFGGTYRLHLQGRRNKFSKNPASKQVAGGGTIPAFAWRSSKITTASDRTVAVSAQV
jgi:hypothetical protein